VKSQFFSQRAGVVVTKGGGREREREDKVFFSRGGSDMICILNYELICNCLSFMC
jgi:hypothetical protein